MFTERAKGTILAHPVINSALEILDDDKLDKEWVIRNILGGMAAGFGLRGMCLFGRIFTCDICLDADPLNLSQLYSIVILRLRLSSSCWDGGLRRAWRGL